MKKRLLLFFTIFFIFTASVGSSNKRIHLIGYIPETIQIKIDYNKSKKITLFNQKAYYLITDKYGDISNINNGYYLEVFMI